MLIVFSLACGFAAPVAAADTPIPQSLIEQGLKNSDCAATYEQATEHLDPPHDLGEGKLLQEFLCRKEDYQYSGILFAYDEAQPGNARLQVFSFPKIRGFESKHSLTSPEFDAKEKMMTSFDKGRKNSVCGSAGEWKWSGREFVLTRYWLKVDCNRGRFDPKRRPDEWLIYPKKKK
ncbi:MAG: DUF1176 domain-containing protein [Methylocella sp.]